MLQSSFRWEPGQVFNTILGKLSWFNNLDIPKYTLPRKLTFLHPEMEVWLRWCSFSIGWFVGYVLIFLVWGDFLTALPSAVRSCNIISIMIIIIIIITIIITIIKTYVRLDGVSVRVPQYLKLKQTSLDILNKHGGCSTLINKIWYQINWWPLSSGKLTWQQKMDLVKMYLLFKKMWDINCHVGSPECN